MAVVIDLHEYKGAAVESSIVGAISNSATTITVQAATNWPTGSVGPFAIVLDRGLSTEEKVLIQSRTGNVLTVATSGRGWDGTSAASHANGATAAHCVDAWTLQLLMNFAADIGNFGARLDTAQTFGYEMTFSDGVNIVGGLTVTNGPINIDTNATVNIDDNVDIDGTLTVSGTIAGPGVTISATDSDTSRVAATGAGTNIEMVVAAKGNKPVIFEAGGNQYTTIDTNGAIKGRAMKFGPDADPAPAYRHGVQAQVAADNIFAIKMAASQTGYPFNVIDSAGAEVVRIEPSGQFRVKGGTHRFGAGAFGGTGPNVALGDLGDTANAYVIAEGSASNYGMTMRGKGTGSVKAEKGDGTLWGSFNDPSGNFTSLTLRTTSGTRTITQGGTDSGGAGKRLLLIDN